MATDLDAVRQRIADKREQVEQARRDQAMAEAAVTDVLVAAQLAAEEARLDAELLAAQNAADPTVIVASNVNNLQAARDAMAIATGEASGATDDENGSTAVKPIGVDLETGKLLSPEEAQAQREQAQTEVNNSTSVDDFTDVTDAVTSAVAEGSGLPFATDTNAQSTNANSNASTAGEGGGN